MNRVHVTGDGGWLSSLVRAAFVGAGNDDATDASEADAVVIVDDAAGGTLEAEADALVGRTARLLDGMGGSVRRVVIATSSDIYGEGPCDCAGCGHVRPANRDPHGTAPWDPRCPRCEGKLHPVAVREDERVQPATPAAALRLAREDLVMAWGRVRGVDTVGLRYFELYGSGRPDGLIAALTRREPAPELPEDGGQTRDLLHADDFVSAVLAALDSSRLPGQVWNISTGHGTREEEAATALGVRGVWNGKPSGLARCLIGDSMRFRHATGWRGRVGLA